MKNYIVRPLPKGGYKAYELCADNYDVKPEEFLITVEEFERGYNNYTFTVEFQTKKEFVNINNWKFPKKISISTHLPGSYRNINSTFDIIDPNGLKLQLTFNDSEDYIYSREGAIDFIFSKFWITALQNVEEYDNYKHCNQYSNWDDEALLVELKSAANLRKALYNYDFDDETENQTINVKGYIEKEYNARLERLLNEAQDKD